MIEPEKVPPILRDKLPFIPVAAPIKQEKKDDGNTVLIYPKNFTKFERWLHKKLGGPEEIRRPLDDKGTLIWSMCNGKSTFHDICNVLDDKYGVEIEPVTARVWKFLIILRDLGLIYLRDPDVPMDDSE
jgi:hypothetical protein